MTAGETVGVCLATAIGILLLASYGFDAWHRPRTRRRFQRTARQAARSRGPLTEDERQAFTQIIAAEFPAGIPHQRRKEDNP